MSATTDLVFVQRRYLDLLQQLEQVTAERDRAVAVLRRIAAEPFDWPAWVEDLDAAIGGAR